MTSDPATDVLRWVREGEKLFCQVLQSLHYCDTLASDNQRLQQEMDAMREELHRLRSERLEAAETLKAIAEHVTRLASVALQRLGRPVA
jgi:predicted nuclease with TOPRIM domain